MRTIIKILIAIVAFIIIAAVFVRHVQIAGGRARVALEKEHEAAREVCETIAGFCENADRLVMESEKRLDVATNALDFVLGSTNLGGLELIAREEPEEGKEKEAEEASTPAPKPRKKPRSSSSPSKKEKKEYFPEGIMSPAELARRKALEEGRSPSPSPRPSEQVETSPRPSQPTASLKSTPSVPDEPDIRGLVRGMWRKTEQLRERAEALREVEASAAKIRDEVLASVRAETAASKARPLPGRLEAARSVEEEARELHQQIEKAAAEVAAIRKQVTEERRKAEEEERRRKEEEKRAAQEERERQLVELVRQDGHKMVLEHRYAEAEAVARARHKQLTTEEAQNGMAVLADRFALMKDLKAFLVSRMAAAKYEWGWGFGPQAVDIIGATDKEIQLQGKRVPWSQVRAAQMMKFVNYYIETVKMRPSMRARRCMEAAIYCDEIALDDEAATYRGRAVDLNPNSRSRLERLLDKK